jgi:group I intron endonuclease
MFIYKITVIPLNQIYIGFDTSPSYKLKRWKTHCKNYKSNPSTKLYKAMFYYGEENCRIEVIEDNFTSIVSLALAEINYIEKFNSYKTGLNSTRGGDGLGKHTLHLLSEEDILLIKQTLGDNFKDYNKNIKWAGTTLSDRKKLTSHLHTEEVYQKKSKTLKKFYEHNPEIKKSKGLAIKKWQEENKDELKARNRINGLKGAEKNSKKLVVEKDDGDVLYFNSKSEFNRITGEWANTIIKKTSNGLFYKGFKIKEINE